MSTEQVIRRYRARAKKMRENSVTLDSPMLQEMILAQASAWDEYSDALEDDVRQSNRYHQEPT